MILATFHDDLYKVLRGMLDGDKFRAALDEHCYKSYLSSRPHDEQMIEARSLGIYFYEKAIAAGSMDEVEIRRARKSLSGLEKGQTYMWYWCAD